jgi:hypothetical protein
MSSGSAKNLHLQPILDEDDEVLNSDGTQSEGDEALEAKIIAKMMLFDASLVNREPPDPMAEKIRDEQRRKRQAHRAKIFGLPMKSDESKSVTFDESVFDITVLDGVVSIKFKNQLLAEECANEIREFLTRRFP